MAAQNEVIASAVVIPDALSRSPTPQESLKRRQSSFSGSSDNKRLRVSVGNEDDTRSARPDANSPVLPSRRESSRKNGLEEERKRGKRLFGNLLGTLSQSTSTTAQQRRIDIEKKQQAKLKLQEAEHDEEKKRRFDKLMERRRKEQKIYDEEAMHRRHENLIHTANSLRTRVEPHLYYKPWELSTEEKTNIETQVREARALVAKEVSEFRQRQKLQDCEEEEGDKNAESAVIETPIERFDVEKASELAAISPSVENSDNTAKEPPDIQEPAALKEAVDDHDESFVEGGEDAVIY